MSKNKGQTTVEYLLIIAVVIIVIATIGSKIKQRNKQELNHTYELQEAR